MPAAFEWGDELPRLVGRKVELRQLSERDLAALFAIFGDPEVMAYWSTPPFKDLEAARVLLGEIDAGRMGKQLFEWGVCALGDDQVIGTCTLYHLNMRHKRAEIGFALRRDRWGQGLARDTIRTLLEFCFDRLDLHRIEADADPHNERSLRVLERQGFKREGYLRERWHHLGQVQDAIVLGLLRHEWTER